MSSQPSSQPSSSKPSSTASSRSFFNRASLLGLLFITAGVLVLLATFDVLQGSYAHLWIIGILLVNSSFFILSRHNLTWGQRVFGFMLLSLGATSVSGDSAGLIALSSAR